MKNTALISTLFLIFLVIPDLKSQDGLWVREYQFNIYNQYDLRNSSTNTISTHRLLQDLYRKNVKPKMACKLGNVTYGFYARYNVSKNIALNMSVGYKSEGYVPGKQIDSGINFGGGIIIAT